MVRSGDDAVLGFERQEDAERVFAVLAKCEKYGLTLHPEKTWLINSGFDSVLRQQRLDRRPGWISTRTA